MVEFRNEVSSESCENISVLSPFPLTLALSHRREREEEFAAVAAFFSRGRGSG
jgi:hypothetical protein